MLNIIYNRIVSLETICKIFTLRENNYLNAEMSVISSNCSFNPIACKLGWGGGGVRKISCEGPAAIKQLQESLYELMSTAWAKKEWSGMHSGKMQFFFILKNFAILITLLFFVCINCWLLSIEYFTRGYFRQNVIRGCLW